MKKFLFVFIFCLFINVLSVNASDIYNVDYSNSNVVTFDRTDSNDLGVNKHWNITSRNKPNVLSTPYVDASLKVYDFAGILTDSEEKKIYNYIEDFIEHTNMDMVFVSIDMSYSYDSKNEDFAADFYDYNDFGINFENYSGILLLRNNYSSDRYYDIYTFGDAQLYFDQIRYDDVLDSIYYDFSHDSYVSGLDTFVSKCLDFYNKGYAYKYRNSYVDANGDIQENNDYEPPILQCFIISGVITLITMIILISKNKMVRKATTASNYLDKDSINYTKSIDQFINSHTTHYTVSSSSGGGGSHSGSSGGGHSCGGGRHG